MSHLIDHAIFRNLQTATGDVFREIIDIYLTDTEARISHLENGFQDISQSDLVKCAHAIKGSSNNIGAASLAGSCDQLERLCRDAVPDDLCIRIKMIREYFSATKKEILAMLESS